MIHYEQNTRERKRGSRERESLCHDTHGPTSRTSAMQGLGSDEVGGWLAFLACSRIAGSGEKGFLFRGSRQVRCSFCEVLYGQVDW